jgi:thiol-disulfide isomerase/thioredoxin
MAQTPSTMLALGTPLPSFSLKNAVDETLVSSSAGLGGKRGLFVAFICNHCPYVKHMLPELVKFSHELVEQGLSVVAINSNSLESHPQDGPEAMKQLALAQGWRFPFVFDDTQAVARAFKAACTPDLFLFDAQGALVYRGQFDDSRPNSGLPVTGASVRAAVTALLSGHPPLEQQKASIGCNIKWKG